MIVDNLIYNQQPLQLTIFYLTLSSWSRLLPWLDSLGLRLP